ncbi:MAG: hypothetical protein ABIF19_18405, partial [Planctomycetota bacterium]
KIVAAPQSCFENPAWRNASAKRLLHNSGHILLIGQVVISLNLDDFYWNGGVVCSAPARCYLR